ncbi:MAG: tetratricopeptide repeat protein [Polyangia bacterium]
MSIFTNGRSISLWLALLLAAPRLAAEEAPDPLAGEKTDPKAQEAEREAAGEDEARARKAYAAAEEHFAAGRYQEALQGFSEAYEISQRADLLYNLAVCHERLGDAERAAARYRLYLEKKPDAEDAEQVRARLEKLVPSGPARQQAPPEEEPAARRDDRELIDLEPAAEEEPGEVFWPGVVIGAGGLVLASGALTTIAAYKKYHDLDVGCSPSCSEAKVSRVKSIAVAADVQLGIGAAAVAAGAIWWILGDDGEAEGGARLAVSPAVGNGGAGAVLRGRF